MVENLFFRLQNRGKVEQLVIESNRKINVDKFRNLNFCCTWPLKLIYRNLNLSLLHQWLKKVEILVKIVNFKWHDDPHFINRFFHNFLRIVLNFLTLEWNYGNELFTVWNFINQGEIEWLKHDTYVFVGVWRDAFLLFS